MRTISSGVTRYSSVGWSIAECRDACNGSLITRLITFLITGIYFGPFHPGTIKFRGDDVGDVTHEFRVEREKNLKSAYLSACRFRQIARVLACGIKLRQHLLFF